MSSLSLIKSVTGGILSGIPLSLTLAPKSVINPVDGKTQTIFMVNVVYNGNFEELRNRGYTVALERQKHNIRIENIENEARKMIEFGGGHMGDDDDMVDEFYPDERLPNDPMAVHKPEVIAQTTAAPPEDDAPDDMKAQLEMSIINFGDGTYKSALAECGMKSAPRSDDGIKRLISKMSEIDLRLNG
jgi:hypothetical protein